MDGRSIKRALSVVRSRLFGGLSCGVEVREDCREGEGLGGGLAFQLGKGFGGFACGLFVFALVPLLREDVVEAFFPGFGGVFADGCDHFAGVVEDDFVDGLERNGRGFGQVERSDLEGVEEQAGAFGVKTAVGDALGDERDGGLDGAAVFEGGQLEEGEGVARLGQEARFVGAVVVVAEVFFAETFAAAAVSVGEDVAALEVLAWCVWHGWYPPGYFAGKVRTDRDLSMELSWRVWKCAAAVAGIFFYCCPCNSLFHGCQGLGCGKR
jgi:hypothetical protein